MPPNNAVWTKTQIKKETSSYLSPAFSRLRALDDAGNTHFYLVAPKGLLEIDVGNQTGGSGYHLTVMVGTCKLGSSTFSKGFVIEDVELQVTSDFAIIFAQNLGPGHGNGGSARPRLL